MCNAAPTKSPNSNEKQSRTPLNAHVSPRVIVEGYRTTWWSVFGRIHDHTVIAGNQLPLRELQTQTSTSLSFTTRMSIMGARRDFQAAPSSNDKESGRFGVQWTKQSKRQFIQSIWAQFSRTKMTASLWGYTLWTVCRRHRATKQRKWSQRKWCVVNSAVWFVFTRNECVCASERKWSRITRRR